MAACPNCGQDVPRGNGFCVICGTDLPAASSATTAAVADDRIRCSCGARNPPDERFCSLCGAPLGSADAVASEPEPPPPVAPEPRPFVPETKPLERDEQGNIHCPACRARNPGDATFCSLCGESFSAPAPASAPAPETAASGGGPVMPGAYAQRHAMPASGGEGLYHDRVERGLSKQNLLDLAAKDLERGAPESAARAMLDACRMDPRDWQLRRRFHELFKENELRYWNLQVPAAPIWSDIPGTLMYPLRLWQEILVSAVFFAVTYFFVGCAGFFALFGLVILFAATANIVTKHMKWSAAGRAGLPGIVELDFSDIPCFLAASVAAFVPSVVVGIVAAKLFFSDGISPLKVAAVGLAVLAAFVLGLVIQPMALLVACLHNRWTMAFSYGFIFHSLRAVLGDYILAIILLGLVSALQTGISSISSALTGSIPDGSSFGAIAAVYGIATGISLVGWTVVVYGYILTGHVLGRVYYNNEHKLGWFDEDFVQPPMGVVGKAMLAGLTVMLLAASIYVMRGTPRERAQKACQSASRCLAVNKGSDAEQLAREALDLHQPYAGAEMLLGQALAAQNRHDEAIQAYDRALSIVPKYIDALQKRGESYMLLGQEHRANRDIEAATRLMEEQGYYFPVSPESVFDSVPDSIFGGFSPEQFESADFDSP